jgi:L-ascorbate metabolism protein UlaG (beta-lactamase superfamily)
MIQNIHWLGHSGFKITGSKIVYIDPYQIDETETADLILITHEHYDHFSKKDVEKILGPETVVIIPASVVASFPKQKTVKPGDSLKIAGVQIHAVPAYNPDKPFHPKSKQWVGYVITLDGTTYYHAGDTDHIPEMKTIDTDIALLPVGGTYTMNAEEAAEAVKDIHPKMAVPMHWGSVVGFKSDAERFEKLCSCEVYIPELDK